MEKLAIVMPVYNEEEAIGAVLDKWVEAMDRLGIVYAIHPYNDGSKDGSWRVIQAKAAEYPGRVIAHTKPNGGHGPTILQGYRDAAESGYDWVFQIDSDDEMGPEGFPELWDHREEYDFLVGIRDGRKQALPRKIISAVSRLSVRLFYGKSIWDVNTPYRLMRVSAFEEVWNAIPKDTFAPNVIISGMAARKKLRCFETRVPQRDRQTGEVSIKKWKLFKAASRSFVQTIVFSFKSKYNKQNFSEQNHNLQNIKKNNHQINKSIVKYRIFSFFLIATWLTIVGIMFMHLPHAKISIVFSANSPSRECEIRTAPCTWRFTRGQCSYKTLIENNTSGRGTQFWIRDLWVAPKSGDKDVEIVKILIDEDVIYAKTLKKDIAQTKAIGGDDYITIKENTRFELRDLHWNKLVNYRIALILSVSLIISAIINFMGYFIYKKLHNNVVYKSIVPNIFSLASLAIMLYVLVDRGWRVHLVTSTDTYANLSSAMHYVCCGKWLFNPFITVGLSYLYPLSVILSCYECFSPENIRHAIFIWNFILFLVPCVVVMFDPKWTVAQKLFLTSVLAFIFIIMPNPFNIAYLNCLYGEMAGSAIFIAAAMMLMRHKGYCALLISGFLFAVSSQIKQVFLIFTIIFIGGNVLDFLCRSRGASFRESVRKVICWGIGFGGLKIAGTIFEIYTFSDFKQYRKYLNNCSIYNFEGMIQIHKWDEDYLLAMWRANWDMFHSSCFGYLLGIIAIFCGIWSIFYFVDVKKNIKFKLSAMLFMSSLGYLVFWFLTSSVSWRFRHTGGAYFIILAGIVFLFFSSEGFCRKMTPWKCLIGVGVIFLFMFPPAKKSFYDMQPASIQKVHSKIYPILEQYHQRKALVCVDGLPQIYFRGYTDLRLIVNLKEIKYDRPVLWCRKKQTYLASPKLNAFKKIELYNDGTFIVERFDPPGKKSAEDKIITDRKL